MNEFRTIFEQVLNETLKKDIFSVSKINKEIKQKIVLEIDATEISKNGFMGIIYEEMDNRIKYVSYPLFGNPVYSSSLKIALNNLKNYLIYFENDEYEEKFRNFEWRKKVKFNDELITKLQQKIFLK